MPSLKPPPGTLVRWDHPQAAGLRIACLLNEGGGGPFDCVRFKPATVTGAPTWTSTVAGIARSGYGTSAYDAIDPAAQILGVTYPCYLAFGVVTSSSTAQQHPGGQSSTSSNNPVMMIGVNQSGAGNTVNSLEFFARDSALIDGSVIAGSRTECSDGNYHVFAGVARSASSRELWLDGRLLTTNSATLGVITAPVYTIGTRRRTAIDLPFLGSIAWHMAGNGAIPDMAWLAREPYAAFAPPATKRFFLPTAAVAFVPPSFAMPPSAPLVVVPY